MRVAPALGHERPLGLAPTEPAEPVAVTRPAWAKRTPPCCPECGSQRVAAVLYGSERIHQLAEVAAGRVVLGGALRPSGAPSWHCRDCEKRWAD